MNPIGLYIHVPFCLRKCPYCDFYSVKPSTHDLDNYVSKLCAEIENWGKKLNRKIDTVYFGGGTPSLLSVEHFRVIFSHIKENFELEKNSEITVEINPTKYDEIDFESLKKLGVNRLSVGLQSANEKELKLLGRTHTAQMAKSTIKKVAKYFKMAKRMTRVALVAVSILAIIFAIIIYKVNKPTFGISLISTGIICIFIKFYSAINVAVNNILVLNKAFSNFAISLINQIIQCVFVSGIVLTVIGILLTILFEKKNTSNEE